MMKREEPLAESAGTAGIGPGKGMRSGQDGRMCLQEPSIGRASASEAVRFQQAPSDDRRAKQARLASPAQGKRQAGDVSQ